MDYSVNEAAAEIVEKEIIAAADKLRVGVIKDRTGATIVDMGINYPGDWEAGRLFVEACLGGLGRVQFEPYRIRDRLVQGVRVIPSQPVIAEMASHVAFWKIDDPKDQRTTVISGPIRAIRGSDIYARVVEYRDSTAERAVGCIQATEYPSSSLIKKIATETDLNPENIYLLVASTASIVGSIQVPARNVEQVMPTLHDHGFDLNNIVQARGIAPVPPIGSSELDAYGRVNDCLIYGNDTTLYVDCDDPEIISILEDIPFSKPANEVYGQPFREMFKKCGCDWSRVPRDWDAPARVTFHNSRSGNSFQSGKLNYELLEKALGV